MSERTEVQAPVQSSFCRETQVLVVRVSLHRTIADYLSTNSAGIQMRKTGKLLIRGGSVITCDQALGTFERADILVEDGLIVRIAPSVDATDAEVLNASGQVVMPGLIDTHRHVTDAVFSGCGCDLTFLDYLKRIP